MAQSQFSLLKTKRFLPLFVTQALGAFNDNALKNSVVILITFKLAAENNQNIVMLTALAAGIFILPFFLFSSLAGQLADKYEKSRLTQNIKLAEIAIVLFGALSLWLESVPMQMFMLFLAGSQSAFFGPIKYGILPQHLEERELVGGNGLIETATFLAILFGTLFGGLLILTDNGLPVISLSVFALALLGYASSRQIPDALPPAPELKIDFNLFRATGRIIGFARQDKTIFRCILGISWFWFLGALFLSQIPAFTKNVLNADETVTNLFLALFSIGIGVGSMWTNKLLKGRVSTKFVPIAAILMTVVMLDLWWGSSAYPASSGALRDISGFLSDFAGWRVAIAFTLIAMLGGLFVVPLYAFIQHWAPAEQLSRIIASINIINACFMVGSSLLVLLLASFKFTVPQIFLTAAILNTLVAIYVCLLLPQEFIKYIGRRLFGLLYRIEVKGMKNYDAAGPRTVIIANHTSFLDAAIMGSFLPDRCSFAINTDVADAWWVKPAFLLFDLRKVDPANPMAIRTLVQQLQQNQRVVIFPEGRITTTGALMKVYDGPGTIAHLAGAKVLPIRIDGAQYSMFSRLRGKVKTRLLPKITLNILPPEDYTAPEELSGKALRTYLAQRLYDTMSDMMFNTAIIDQNLVAAVIDTKSVFGRKKLILEDIQRTPLNYGRVLTGIFVLGKKLAKLTPNEKTIGVLLPSAAGAVVTFLGLHAYGRIPAMLNFSTGAMNMAAACTAAQVETIVTSRRFIEEGEFHDDIALLSKQARVIYLEDVRETISALSKISGLVKSYFPKLALSWAGASKDANSPAVVLFTSGSEGVPKGVVLSHRNLLANCKQVAARIDFGGHDVVFNALPAFHAFGLLGGVLLPLLSGVRSFQYPSPLHYKIVPELVYATNTTILFGTDTFLAGYARNAHVYDFYSVRYVVAGAERVKPETRETWMEKFGLRILEGYGATECSPVLAVNTPMHFRSGSVGRLLGGIDYRLEAVDGIEEGGRFFVKGPNVMLGYLRADNPGEIEAPPDQWYDTGDIVDIDELRYVTIKGRAKRFAKIAGEMVSLTAVETAIEAAFDDGVHAVVSIPDAKKGEQLVLVTTDPGIDRKALQTALKAAGLSELMIPRTIELVDILPVLGSGKTDYVSINKLARGQPLAAE